MRVSSVHTLCVLLPFVSISFDQENASVSHHPLSIHQHLSIESSNMKDLAKFESTLTSNIRRLAALGLLVHITEVRTVHITGAICL
jgi:hypothetical protein